MAPLRYAAKWYPFPSLDCAPTPSTLAQSKEWKGSIFAIWQPCFLQPIEGTNLLLSLFPVLLLHPGHQLGAAVRVHRLQPVQPGVDHVPAVGHHVQDHQKVPGPLRAGRGRQEAAGDGRMQVCMRLIKRHLFTCCMQSAPCLEVVTGHH